PARAHPVTLHCVWEPVKQTPAPFAPRRSYASRARRWARAETTSNDAASSARLHGDAAGTRGASVRVKGNDPIGTPLYPGSVGWRGMGSWGFVSWSGEV